MSFLGEIKRRKVFQVAAVYAVVAWLLVQVVATIERPLDLPEWFTTAVIVLLAVGFPVALILAWAFDMTPHGLIAADEAMRLSTDGIPTGQRLNYLMHGLVLIAVGYLVVDQYLPSNRPDSGSPSTEVVQSASPVRRFNINLLVDSLSPNLTTHAEIAISPDGGYLAYVVPQGNLRQLYLLALDQGIARAIPGTEGAENPFFSADGEWVAFYTDSTDALLKKVSVRGGLPQTLASTFYSSGGSWSSNDTIVFGGGDGDSGRSLYRISSSGGELDELLSADSQQGYARPELLPNGTDILLVIRPGSGGAGRASNGTIAVLSTETGELRNLISGGYAPRYAQTGHIIFARAGGLWAVPFDTERMETTGPEVQILDGVQHESAFGWASYDFSHDGLLVYTPGGDVLNAEQGRELVWVDMDGNEEPVSVEQRNYLHPSVSPDGRYIAFTINDSSNRDVWTHDIVRGTLSRLTFDPLNDYVPLWTPDGQRILFTSDRDGGGLYWKTADGSGEAELLFANQYTMSWPMAFSPDGAELYFGQLEDVWRAHTLLVNERRAERYDDEVAFGVGDGSWVDISANGEWIAYSSAETGRFEIYVRPYPDVEEGKWQISSTGGTEPIWAPDGGYLYFRNPGNSMMAVSITTDTEFIAGTPRPLFEDAYVNIEKPSFSLSSDGQRFLMMKSASSWEQVAPGLGQVKVVDNWFEELRRLVPPADRLQ